MESKEVKLLGLWVSPIVRRVEWALKVKGVEYEYIEEDIYNKSSLLLELNPVHKKVPVLVHDGKAIAESLVIVEYVDETWKQNPLLPEDPHQRALARFWAKFCEEKVLSAAWNALISEGEEKQTSIEECKEALGKMEEEVFKGKLILGGGERSNIGYLDIAAGWIPYWLPVFEEVGSMQILDPQQFPATTAWINRFLNHSVIKDNLPPREKMPAYFHKRSQELLNKKEKLRSEFQSSQLDQDMSNGNKCIMYDCTLALKLPIKRGGLNLNPVQYVFQALNQSLITIGITF